MGIRETESKTMIRGPPLSTKGVQTQVCAIH